MPGTIAQFAVCSVCNVHLTARTDIRAHSLSRCPLVLNCGHAACEQCVRSTFLTQRAKILVCGYCIQPSQFHGSGAEDVRVYFPLHAFVVGQLTIRSLGKQTQEPNVFKNQWVKTPEVVKPKTADTITCNECQKSCATCFCKQCDAPYCNSCFDTVHQSGRTLRSHVRQSIHVAVIKDSLMCPRHPKVDLDMFCETCSESVCLKCSFLSHKGHDVVGVTEKNEGLLPDLKKSLDSAGQLRQRLKLSLKEAKQLSATGAGSAGGSPEADDVLLAVQRDLARHLIQTHGRMQLMGERWWGRIEEKLGENLACLDKIQASLEASLGALEAAMRAALSASTGDNLATANLEAVKARLDDALAVPAHIVHHAISAELKLNSEPLDGLEKLIELNLSKEIEYCLVSEDELPSSHVMKPLPCDDFNISLGIDSDWKTQYIPDSCSNFSSSLTSTSTISPSSSTSSVHIAPAGMPITKKPKVLVDPYEGLKKGSCVKVSFSHLTDPSDFYVHLCSSLDGLRQFEKALSKAAKCSLLATNIEINEIYLAQYHLDKEWYRGRIVKKILSSSAVTSPCYEVHFIDYGNSATLKPSLIKCLPPKFADVPNQAIRCGLYHLQAEGCWKKSAIVDMTSLVDIRFLEMYILDVLDDKLLVDLHHLPSGNKPGGSIRDAMIYLGHGSALGATDSQVSIKVQHSSPKFVQICNLAIYSTHKIVISHVDSPSCFFCVLEENWNCSIHIKSEILKYCSDEKIRIHPVLNPTIGKPCLAQWSDEQYYRAVVTEVIVPGKVIVRFVDFGNKAEISWEKVVQIPDHLLKYPEQALQFSLADVVPVGEEWTEQDITSFEDLINKCEKKSLSLKVIAKKGTSMSVLLYGSFEDHKICINDLLVQNGIAEYTVSRSFKKEEDQTKPLEVKLRLPDCISTKDCPIDQPLFQRMDAAGVGVSESWRTEKTMESQSLSKESSPSSSGVLLSKSQARKSNPNSLNSKSLSSHDDSSSSDELNVHSDGDLFTSTKVLSMHHQKNLDSKPLKSVSNEFKASLENRNGKTLSSRSLTTHSRDEQSSASSHSKKCDPPVPPKSSVQVRLKQAQQHVPVAASSLPIRLPVDIVHVESPSSIFARVKNRKEEMERLQLEMQRFYNDEELLGNSTEWSPTVMGRCAARSEADYLWHRAIVLEAHAESKYTVMLKDIGSIETVAQDSIRMLAEKFTLPIDGVIKCHLANVKIAGSSSVNGKPAWSSLACEQLQALLKEHEQSLYISKRGKIEDRSLPVELWVCHTVPSALDVSKEEWFTINRTLVNNGVALPVDWASMTQPEETSISEDDWHILNPADDPDATVLAEEDSDMCDSCHEMDSNDNREGVLDWLPPEPFPKAAFMGKVTYVDYDCQVYIHDIQRSGRTLKHVNRCFNRKFSKSDASNENMFWFPNQLCAVLYHDDKQWYRGKTIKVNSDHTIQVKMVDYGNIEKCRSTEIRKTSLCHSIPAMARVCRIAGFEPASPDKKWSNDVLDSVHGFLVDKECHVEVLRAPTVEDNVYLVKLILDGVPVDDFLAERNLGRCVPTAATAHIIIPEAPSDDEPDVVVLEVSHCELKPSMTHNETQNGQKLFKLENSSYHQSCFTEEQYSQSEEEASEDGRSYMAVEIPASTKPSTFGNTIWALNNELPQEIMDFPPPAFPSSNNWLVAVTAILSTTDVVLQIKRTNNSVETINLSSFQQIFNEIQRDAYMQPQLVVFKNSRVPCVFESDDGIWYRGLVVSLHEDDLAEVEQVDGGLKETISITKLRQIKPHWLEHPILGVKCSLNCDLGSEVSDEDMPEVFTILSRCLFVDQLDAVLVTRNPIVVELYREDETGVKALAYQELLDKGYFVKKS